MEQEDKDLLLKDLSTRLPYGVKVAFISVDDYAHDLITIDTELLNAVRIKGKRPGSEYDRGPDVVGMWTNIKNIKPYLFPLSSMTEEQKMECFKGTNIELDEHNEIWSIFPMSQYHIVLTSLDNWLKVINWLLKNHFDIYGLILMGLAIDCTNLNIY